MQRQNQVHNIFYSIEYWTRRIKENRGYSEKRNKGEKSRARKTRRRSGKLEEEIRKGPNWINYEHFSNENLYSFGQKS